MSRFARRATTASKVGQEASPSLGRAAKRASERLRHKDAAAKCARAWPPALAGAPARACKKSPCSRAGQDADLLEAHQGSLRWQGEVSNPSGICKNRSRASGKGRSWQCQKAPAAGLEPTTTRSKALRPADLWLRHRRVTVATKIDVCMMEPLQKPERELRHLLACVGDVAVEGLLVTSVSFPPRVSTQGNQSSRRCCEAGPGALRAWRSWALRRAWQVTAPLPPGRQKNRRLPRRLCEAGLGACVSVIVRSPTPRAWTHASGRPAAKHKGGVENGRVSDRGRRLRRAHIHNQAQLLTSPAAAPMPCQRGGWQENRSIPFLGGRHKLSEYACLPNPATRSRARDHLIAAAIYSQRVAHRIRAGRMCCRF